MIEVKDLQFTYPGAKQPTLKGLNFSIPAGEIFGFLGPSGAGKSTIQKILIGILKQYSGSVRVQGSEIRNSPSDYYEKIGVAFEFPNFYTRFTALENLSLFRSLYKGKTEDPKHLLAMVDLDKYAHTKISDFSKGMKMRLNFCRALLGSPDILFLDEPTSGLDPVNAKVMKDLILARQQQGTTILLTTHHMSAADELCDRVAFIVNGGISLIDSPRELKVRNGRSRVQIEYTDRGQLQRRDFDLQQIGSNQAFLQLLRTHPIETMHTQEATLEDVFIQVTGESLR
ncbi:ATP-binding cassette domain-containing protein [Paenibacillus sp. EC2-1]|uniref:ABC transporter ATP-binding protein n=1 Tax=Paenibacillus sp. EC2-1 TaxID=3388665 RepID=UPI003BEEDBA7